LRTVYTSVFMGFGCGRKMPVYNTHRVLQIINKCMYALVQ
jgi:hypothetical protein